MFTIFFLVVVSLSEKLQRKKQKKTNEIESERHKAY